ncbi:asparagine synthase (glutamine-hydrolyzing) [Chlorobium ferrooxidans]|nr:asparagine synthase (glutamine-hydrolyzing) [Chlorobium ferrooxidans]
MCGFTGFLGRAAGSSKDGMEALVTRMALAIQHRGPDDAGAWADSDSGIALGHRRLSIIDLSSAGHQPMHSASGRFVIAFNGEIYNHNTLRSELQQNGLSPEWRGHSDTETLLAGFDAWGVKATLQRAAGMFAFALWDKVEMRLVLARDRFGEKPLYYGWTGRGEGRAFVFGSELKTLRAYPGFDNPVNRSALGLYFQFCTIPAPYSIYEDIHKLLPGTILTVSAGERADSEAVTEPYWTLTDAVQKGFADQLHDEGEAVAMLDATLREAVKIQAVADVPLGAFLSGGVDSSTVVALMQAQSRRPVQTFTIGFEEAGFDESPHALAVARHLGTDHHELRVSSGDARSAIPLLPRLYDEPFADSSQIPTYFVCKAARQKVTVSLSGDGGDELFGGYNRYFWGKRIWNRIDWLPPVLRRAVGQGIQSVSPEAWDKLGGMLPGSRSIARLGDKAHKLATRMQTVNSLDDLYRSLVTEWPTDLNPAKGAGTLATQLDNAALVAGLSEPEERMMLWDTLTYLPDDILTKVDRAAMGVSLETRVPFLDHRVAELAWRLPLNMKIRGGEGKWALRQVLYSYVPRELIERPKAGFGIPVGQWIRGPLREWAEALLDERRLKEEGYLNALPIRTIWQQHLSGRHDWTVRLWTVLMFQAWLEETR